MLTDPIADMLTRIRNALGARLPKAEVPSSKLKIQIARILKEEGYVANYRVSEEDGKSTIKVYLRYDADNQPIIQRIDRVSKPGRRVYTSSKKVPRVIGGMGINIVTTSQGVMTGQQARQKGVGGEILCNVE